MANRLEKALQGKWLKIEDAKAKNMELHVTSLSLMKAFDRVPRTAIWKALGHYGTLPKLIETAQKLQETLSLRSAVKALNP